MAQGLGYMAGPAVGGGLYDVSMHVLLLDFSRHNIDSGPSSVCSCSCSIEASTYAT